MEKIAEKKLLSKLLIIRSDLENVNPKDFEDDVSGTINRIKRDVEFLIQKFISNIKNENIFDASKGNLEI